MPVFLLAGQKIEIDKEAVDMKAMELEPEQVLCLNYTVEAGGKVFPIKQLLAKVVKLPQKAFITHDAYKVFTELGYDVKFNRKK